MPVVDISTTSNKKNQLLGFRFLPDDHYNPYISSSEKGNPQKCSIYFFEAWEVEKEMVDILTSRHERVKGKRSELCTTEGLLTS